MNSAERIRIFGMSVDRVDLSEAVHRINDWCDNKDYKCHYVVTPNLDHAVQFQNNAVFRTAYEKASLVVADGWPIVTASRIFANALPERVAGSDLIPALLSSARPEQTRTLFLLGAAEGVADVAAVNICQKWPAIKVVGTYSPPFGFERDAAVKQDIIRRVNYCRPDLLIVGFGAPKQELWLSECHDRLSVGVAIAAGATIDFLAGRQTRAPLWVRQWRLEWSHRLLTNPRRLAGRYATNAWQFPWLMYREYFGQRDSVQMPRPPASK